MNHPMPEINIFLKQLRLSHIMEQLSARNREAIERKMPYPEFLSLLLQDEIVGRETTKFKNRIRRAAIRVDKNLESFDFDFNPKVNRAQIEELATCRFITEKAPVLIVGPCGTGKSHLAQALAHCAIRQGIDALWFSQSKLFTELQTARASGKFEKKFSELIKVPLLIIDDFGLRPLRSPEDEDLQELIGARYEQAATIVTSNLDFSEWGNAFPNKLLAVAVLDRLRHNAHRIILEGASFRAGRDSKTTAKEVKNEALKKSKI